MRSILLARIRTQGMNALAVFALIMALLWVQSAVLGISVTWGYRLLLGADGTARRISLAAEDNHSFLDGSRIRRRDRKLSSAHGRLLLASDTVERRKPHFNIQHFFGSWMLEPDPQWVHWEGNWFPTSWEDEFDPITGWQVSTKRILGVHIGPKESWAFGESGSGWEVAVPYWIPLLVSGTPVATKWFIRLRRRRKQHRAAALLCVRCGYDLRASVARCPECGEPIAELG